MTDGKWLLSIIFVYIIGFIISLIALVFENTSVPSFCLMFTAVYMLVIFRFKITLNLEKR